MDGGMNEWIDGWMDGWMDAGRNVWMDGWLVGGINGRLNKWEDKWMDGGCMNERMIRMEDGQTDGRMIGYMYHWRDRQTVR